MKQVRFCCLCYFVAVKASSHADMTSLLCSLISMLECVKKKKREKKNKVVWHNAIPSPCLCDAFLTFGSLQKDEAKGEKIG